MTILPKRGLYSEQSRHHLRRKASALVTAIEQHATEVIEPPGPGNPSELSELNRVVRSAVAGWDDAVFRHTGTFPVGVGFDEDDEQDQA